MRILFLSNYFPPHSRGGYEQWCEEVAQALVGRNHHLCVLTTRDYGHQQGQSERRADQGLLVKRLLYAELEGGLLQTAVRLAGQRVVLERRNLQHVRSVIAEFRPDVALIWGMWNIPRTVPALVEELLPGRVAYYLCDYWLALPSAYLQRLQTPSNHRLLEAAKRWLTKPVQAALSGQASGALQLRHPICVSRALRALLVEQGVPVDHAEVIHGGTQVEEFTAATASGQQGNDGPLKLLFAGRLEPDKGLHTVIRALGFVAQRSTALVTLAIYGSGDPGYQAHLQALVQAYGLEQTVTFCGRVARSAIPYVFAQHHGLVFSSEWQEPFARTVLEAMAAGLAVIGTTTGGTVEILREGVTGLTYPAGDPLALGMQIERLASQPTLRQRLAHCGQACVAANFTFTGMVDRIEGRLDQIRRS